MALTRSPKKLIPARATRAMSAMRMPYSTAAAADSSGPRNLSVASMVLPLVELWVGRPLRLLGRFSRLTALWCGDMIAVGPDARRVPARPAALLWYHGRVIL